ACRLTSSAVREASFPRLWKCSLRLKSCRERWVHNMSAESKIVFQRPKALLPVVTNYCPGCPHGIVHRLVAETIDELGVEGDTIGIAPVGCAVTSPDFFACDMIEAAHGRAPAVATAVKRVLPKSVVFAYQGDGDLASIGMAETIHAA